MAWLIALVMDLENHGPLIHNLTRTCGEAMTKKGNILNLFSAVYKEFTFKKKKSLIQATLGPLVCVGFKSTYIIIKSQYHESKSIPQIHVCTISQNLYHESKSITNRGFCKLK